MTEQIPDGLYYERELYRIVRVKGEGLIYPEQFGMETYGMNSACWRGYISSYSILVNRLLLKDMDVSTDAYRPINGIVADERGSYLNLNMEVPYTGGILAAVERISEVGLYYTYPHSYAKLMEFRFEDGSVISIEDRSERMAEIRKKILQQQTWDIEHRAELDEIARLRKYLNTLKESIPVSLEWLNNESGAELPEDKIEVIKEDIQAEMVTIQAKIKTLSDVFYPPWDATTLSKWLTESFSLNYGF